MLSTALDCASGERLACTRVMVTVHPPNEAVLALYKGAGFVETGITVENQPLLTCALIGRTRARLLLARRTPAAARQLGQPARSGMRLVCPTTRVARPPRGGPTRAGRRHHITDPQARGLGATTVRNRLAVRYAAADASTERASDSRPFLRRPSASRDSADRTTGRIHHARGRENRCEASSRLTLTMRRGRRLDAQARPHGPLGGRRPGATMSGWHLPTASTS